MKAFRLPLILLAVLAVLASVAYWDEQKTASDEAAKKEAQRFVALKPEDVTAIHYVRAAAEGQPAVDVTLAKEDKAWHVKAPLDALADEATVSTMLTSIADYQFEKKIEGRSDHLADYGLADPAITVTLTTPAKTHVVKFGVKAPVGYSVYLALDGDPNVYMGSQYLLTNATKTLHDFRDKRVVRFEKERVSRLDLAGARGSFAMVRDGTKWKYLAPRAGDRPDEEEVNGFLGALLNLNAESFVDAPSPAMQKLFAAGNPGTTVVNRITLGDVEGKSQSFTIVKNGEEVLAARDPAALIYRLEKDADKRFAKGYDDFLNKRVFEYDYSKIRAVTFDGKELTRKGDVWEGVPGGRLSQEALTAKVQRLLTSLELATTEAFLPLAANKPADPAPAHTLALAFAAGTQPERVDVTFWKDKAAADKFLVQVAGSASLYRVPTSVLADIVDLNGPQGSAQKATPGDGAQAGAAAMAHPG